MQLRKIEYRQAAENDLLVGYVLIIQNGTRKIKYAAIRKYRTGFLLPLYRLYVFNYIRNITKYNYYFYSIVTIILKHLKDSNKKGGLTYGNYGIK